MLLDARFSQASRGRCRGGGAGAEGQYEEETAQHQSERT